MKMEFDSIVSEGLGDRDERFRVHTPPITQPIITQPLPPSLLTISHESSSSLNQLDNLPIPLTVPSIEKTFSTNDNVEEMNGNITNEPSNQIVLFPPVPIKIEETCNDSRDQFVKVLTKEAFTSQSPSSTLSVSPRRRSSSDDDDNDLSNTNTHISSTRTVILVSNNDEDNLIIKTTNTDPPEEEMEEDNDDEEEPEATVKRIKMDLVSPAPLATDRDSKSVLPSSTDDCDYRQDFDERRQFEEMSRSRSQSSSSHTSSNKESNAKSLPITNNNHHRHKQQFRRHEPNRSYQYQQRNKPTITRHQRFNYNHQSVADHPRFSHSNPQSSSSSSSSTRPNYSSFSASNYSQSQK